MEKEPDKYCKNIITMIFVSDGKIRFNELHRKLEKYNAQMTKPTLIEHLNHLLKQKVILRNEEGKQKVFYELNLKRLKQLSEATKDFQSISKEFNSQSLTGQTFLAAVGLHQAELYDLKLSILDILEPKNKLQNLYSCILIKRLWNIPAALLIDSCKKSEEKARKTLNLIDTQINQINPTVEVLAKSHTHIDLPSKKDAKQ